MNTEITDTKKAFVFYDGDCRLCTASARRMERILHKRGFELQPLQAPWVGERLGRAREQLLAEMHLLLPDGRIFAGADAFAQLSRYYWWGWPFYLFAHLPGAKPVLDALYRWVARNRTCLNGACEINRPGARRKVPTAMENIIRFLPLVVLPALALCGIRYLPPWVFMWLLAFALYAACKWLTYREAAGKGLTATLPRAIGYLLLWPGMDAAAFFRTAPRALKPCLGEWISALAKTVLGVSLVWFLPRYLVAVHPLLAGWIGMIGVVFLLHFGAFHLLSIVWRCFGINAMPIMHNPMLATSVAEFWGRRWNVAFHELARRYTFRPFRRMAGVIPATLLVFVVSGLVHDLLISLPARGGYGLPTVYFFVQGLGVIGEHTKLGRRIGLGHGPIGWAFTVLVTAGPVGLLFHPPFIRNVILPMPTPSAQPEIEP